MARRNKNQSALLDFMDLATILPIPVSLTLAVVAFFIIDSSIVPPTSEPGKPTSTFILLYPLLSALKFVVPLALLAGALARFLKDSRARGVARNIQNYQTEKSTPTDATKNLKVHSDPVASMSWSDFELLVGEAFRQRGFRVVHGADPGADGGIDVRLTKNGKRYIVQCKHWKTARVGVSVIREQFGIMVSEGAAGAFLVTSGDFTNEAKEFAGDKPITLVNGDELYSLLGRSDLALSKGQAPTSITESGPLCPKCGSNTVLRQAKRGANAGKQFWGCGHFPDCRGVVNIESNK
jgi:restriction system protein